MKDKQFNEIFLDEGAKPAKRKRSDDASRATRGASRARAGTNKRLICIFYILEKTTTTTTTTTKSIKFKK